jgi:hypothetical protein
MATAVYRVGRSDFFTPGDLEADASTLDAQVTQLDNALDGNEQAPSDWWDGWNSFVAQWRGFYGQTFKGKGFFGSLLSALNDSNRDELVSFETRFDTWNSQAANYSAALPAGSHTGVSEGSGDSLSNHLKDLGLPSVGGLTLLIAVALGAYLAWRAFK